MNFTPGAWRYAAPAFALAIPVVVFTPIASLAAIALGVAVLLFHRDPERSPPAAGVVAPADGKVSVVREESVTGEEDESEEDERVRIGVFMNVTDVHVNRAPLGGRVEAVDHEPGKHRPAFSKESDNNEKVHVRFAGVDGTGDRDGIDDHEVTLIAGAFARRIHPYVEPGEELVRGERLGHISFGSRADVLLPPSVELADVAVERGQTVRAGETVLVEESALNR